ncbi:MAG: type II secretion system protein GspJ [Rhodobacter sp.]|nr:type II secretion system protein GspJ [Rhodobacter sp.]
MRRRRDTGFTLLELVAVLAIFAVVALIGVKVVEQTLRSNDRLVELSGEAAELAYGLSLLRQDLNAALDLPFRPPGGAVFPSLDAPARGEAFSLTVGGTGTLDGRDPGQARVTWRFDAGSGAVSRQVWPVLAPANARVQGGEVTIFREILGFELEGYVPERGWTVGFPGNEGQAVLPQALRVRLTHARLDLLETVVTLR